MALVYQDDLWFFILIILLVRKSLELFFRDDK